MNCRDISTFVDEEKLDSTIEDGIVIDLIGTYNKEAVLKCLQRKRWKRHHCRWIEHDRVKSIGDFKFHKKEEDWRRRIIIITTTTITNFDRPLRTEVFMSSDWVGFQRQDEVCRVVT